MPVYNEEQREGLPKTYWKVKSGRFTNNDQPDGVNTIEGIFNGVHLREDPGKPDKRIEPGPKVGIRIQDGEHMHVIDFRPNIYFASSFASRLTTLKAGDQIKIVVKPGDKDDKVSFCNILRYADGDWKEVPYEAIDAKIPKEREIRVMAIINEYNGVDGQVTNTDEVTPPDELMDVDELLDTLTQ